MVALKQRFLKEHIFLLKVSDLSKRLCALGRKFFTSPEISFNSHTIWGTFHIKVAHFRQAYLSDFYRGRFLF